MLSDPPAASLTEQRQVHWTGTARLAVAVAPPGPVAAWIACLLSHIARGSQGEVIFEELREDPDLTPVAQTYRILFGHMGVAVESALASWRIPIIAVFDDVDISTEFMCANGAEPIDAIRVHSAAFALAPALRNNPAAFVVARSSELTGVQMADAILAHLGIALSPALRQETLGWLGLEVTSDASFEAAIKKFGADYEIPAPDVTNLSKSTKSWILTILVPMLRMAWKGPHPPIEWPIDVLLLPGQDTPAPRTLPLAGPPRCLIYGPYVHVPRGRYEVEFLLGVSKPIGAKLFAMELHDNDCVARAEIRLGSAGIYRGHFYFEQQRPDIRLSVRLRIEESAIEGWLALAHVRLHRLEAS